MKRFQHISKPFRVFPHIDPNWVGSGYILHVPTKITIKRPLRWYVESMDKMFEISIKDLLEHRAMYNGRWHIDMDFLTEVPISEADRKEIDSYKAKYAKERPDKSLV